MQRYKSWFRVTVSVKYWVSLEEIQEQDKLKHETLKRRKSNNKRQSKARGRITNGLVWHCERARWHICDFVRCQNGLCFPGFISSSGSILLREVSFCLCCTALLSFALRLTHTMTHNLHSLQASQKCTGTLWSSKIKQQKNKHLRTELETQNE